MGGTVSVGGELAGRILECIRRAGDAAMATQTPSEEDLTYFSGLVLQQKWEGCLEFMWAKCGE